MQKAYDVLALLFWALYFMFASFSPGIALVLYFGEHHLHIAGYAAFVAVFFTAFHIAYICRHNFIVAKIEKHLQALRGYSE